MFRWACIVLAAGLCLEDASAKLFKRQGYNNQLYNQTFFPSLDNYQVNATLVSEAQYPWAARVVHSRSRAAPLVCSAAALQTRIFITAARCIVSLKVHYTTVLYMNARHPALAFVVPRNETKQAFDDVGLIVVTDEYKGEWPSIGLIDVNRTDDAFKWFDQLKLSFGPHDHRVIGYATAKGFHRLRTPDKKFDLFELKVIVGIGLCQEILTLKNRIRGFFVPCYHSCNVHEFDYKKENCRRYLGVEGGAVIDAKAGQLIGVATWGAYSTRTELPVGISVPNSEAFYQDYECAKRIRNDKGSLYSKGHYQSLCPD